MIRGASGFTLVEIAVVVAIIGVLAVAAVPVAELSVQRGREQELRHALRQLRGALDAYKQAWDEGRIQRRTGESGYPPSLQALVDGVPDARDPNGTKLYFLRRLPRDPFVTDGEIRPGDTWGKRAYASPPDMPYEGADVFDVYSLSERVGLNGIPYREW